MLNLMDFPKSNKRDWPHHYDSIIEYDTSVSWPKISIVTPSFNQGQFIEETIRSVLLQNYPNLEYIIIDGGSDDETVEIIKKYDCWITYWVSEPDRGQSHAINKGLEKCTGDIFNWLNSDDWYPPNSLYEVATQFLGNPTAYVVSGFENHMALDGSFSQEEGTFLKGTLVKTLELCQVAQPSTFFKLSAIKTIGPVPEDVDYVMDGELWMRFLLMYGQHCFVKVPKPLVNFRLHEGSKTLSNAIVNNFLYERSSIIADLQKFIGLPDEIISFWTKEVYKTSKCYIYNRTWQLNHKYISGRQLRIHFLQKYINYQFQDRNLDKAAFGMLQLIANGSFDFFTLKSLIKLIIRLIVHEK